MANYQKEVTAYTKGLGKVTIQFAGYYPCHNTEEVVAQTGYDPERDLSHPAVLFSVRTEQDLSFHGMKCRITCMWKAGF